MDVRARARRGERTSCPPPQIVDRTAAGTEYRIPHTNLWPIEMKTKKIRWHQHTGTALATLMWLWVFYRCKEDGAVVLGLVHPWDAHGHDDDHHHFEKEAVGDIPSAKEEHH